MPPCPCIASPPSWPHSPSPAATPSVRLRWWPRSPMPPSTVRQPASSRFPAPGITNSLTVNYALGGTAAKWTDYYRLPEGDMPVCGDDSRRRCVRRRWPSRRGPIPPGPTRRRPSYALGGPSYHRGRQCRDNHDHGHGPALPSVSVVATVADATPRRLGRRPAHIFTAPGPTLTT
jgi:hypothetical protein